MSVIGFDIERIPVLKQVANERGGRTFLIALRRLVEANRRAVALDGAGDPFAYYAAALDANEAREIAKEMYRVIRERANNWATAHNPPREIVYEYLPPFAEVYAAAEPRI